MRNEVPNCLAKARVMLSEAKHLWLLPDSEKNQRFFSRACGIRMTV
jgi:hypothetical protein